VNGGTVALAAATKRPGAATRRDCAPMLRKTCRGEARLAHPVSGSWPRVAGHELIAPNIPLFLRISHACAMKTRPHWGYPQMRTPGDADQRSELMSITVPK